MAKRVYAVKEIKKLMGRAADAAAPTAMGGTAILTAKTHRHDGPEHTALLPIERISTAETDPTLVVAPDGIGGLALRAGLTVKDEGTPLATAATSLDFVGTGVTASGTGATKTITIPDTRGLPLALTGAIAATRYVGATASGAPVTGTFAVGDFVIDQTPAVWVCTAAGSPGTWASLSGGGGGGLSDMGTITYLDGTVAAAPGTPGSGKLRLYAKTGKVLAVKDDTGAETVLGAGGGGGSDLVQVASGAGSVVIPGLKGSPDAVPGSPSAYDDEFGALSGWTTLGSLDTLNATDVPSHVHLKKTTSGIRIDGIYKACPSMPFTVTAKLTDQLFQANYQQAGIMLGEASPGKLIVFGARFHTGAGGITWEYSTWTNNTTHVADGDTNVGIGTTYLQGGALVMPYIRFVVASSTSVTMQVSRTGLSWFTVYSGLNPGFTIGAVGLHLYGYSGAPCESWVDWVRFS